MKPRTLERNFSSAKKISGLLSLGVLGILGWLWYYFTYMEEGVLPPKSVSEIRVLVEQGEYDAALSAIQYAFYFKYSSEYLRLQIQIYLQQARYQEAFEGFKRLVTEKEATTEEIYFFARLAELLWGKLEALNLLESERESSSAPLPLLLELYLCWLQKQAFPNEPVLVPNSIEEYLFALIQMQQKNWEQARTLLSHQENFYAKYHLALLDLKQRASFQDGCQKIRHLAESSWFPAVVLAGYLELKLFRLKEAETYFLQAKKLVPDCLWSEWGLWETRLKMGQDVSLRKDLDFFTQENWEKEHRVHGFSPLYVCESESFPYPQFGEQYVQYSLLEQYASLYLLKKQPENALALLSLKKELSLQGKILEGEALFAKGEYELLESKLRLLLEEHPSLLDARFLWVEVALQTKKISLALAEVYKILKLSPEHPKGFYFLGKIYEAQGDWERAQVPYSHGLTLSNPMRPLTRLLRLLTQSGQIEKAYELYQRYPQTYPDEAYLYAVGLLLGIRRDYGLALDVWNRLLERKLYEVPMWEIYWNKAICLKNIREDKHWLIFVQKTLEHQPPPLIYEQALQSFEDASAWKELLLYLQEGSNTEKARKVKALVGLKRYEEALVFFDPEDFRDVSDILRIYRLQKNWQAQVQLLEKWTKIQKKRPYLEYELAEAYFHLEEEKKALKRLGRVLAEDPNFLSAWMLKGEIFLQQKKFRESITCFEEVLARHSSLAKAYFLKGKAHYQLQEYEQAQQDYLKAVSYDASYAQLHY